MSKMRSLMHLIEALFEKEVAISNFNSKNRKRNPLLIIIEMFLK